MLQDDFVPAPPDLLPVRGQDKISELKTRRVQLVVRCQDLARFLRDHEEVVWARWIDARVTEISLGQPEGVCNLLAGFTGIGNIGDVFLCEEAGHCVSPGDETAINEQFLLLLSAVNTHAHDVQRLIQPVAVRRR